MSRDLPTYPEEDEGERIPRTLAEIQAMYDRANVPLSDAGQRIIDAARSNLPRHDEAVARADAARAAFRVSADWSKPDAYRTWERLEREYWGACRDRTDCRANACLPRDIAVLCSSFPDGIMAGSVLFHYHLDVAPLGWAESNLWGQSVITVACCKWRLATLCQWRRISFSEPWCLSGWPRFSRRELA